MVTMVWDLDPVKFRKIVEMKNIKKVSMIKFKHPKRAESSHQIEISKAQMEEHLISSVL